MLLLTRAQVREVDRRAMEELGIPGVVLMENAARAVAEAVLDVLEADLQVIAADATVAVVCGGGNNGGDGYAAARHLHNAGALVTLYAATPLGHLAGDAGLHAGIAQRMGLVIRDLTQPAELAVAVQEWAGVTVIVDALLGTGFQGELRPPTAAVIAEINMARARGVKVVAVDVPSGLDADRGPGAGAMVQADVTVTFVGAKPGLLARGAEAWVGQLVVGDIGVGPELVRSVLQGV